MFDGAPLIVIAQALRALGFVLELAVPHDAPSFASPFFLVVIAFPIEMLGFFDLSRRTRGLARGLARVLWVVPLLAVAAMIVGGYITGSGSFAQTTSRWVYAGDSLVGVIALWTTARRGAALAIGALVITLVVTVAPILELGVIHAFVRATGIAGELLLVVVPPVLSGVLAVFAGRAADPVPFDLAKTRRSLMRAPLPIAALATMPILVLTGSDSTSVFALVAILGCLLLVIPAFRIRARSRLAYVTIVLAVYAAGSIPMMAAVSSMYDDVAPFDVAILAALGALLFAVARRRYAIAFVVIAVLAIALHGRKISVMCELAAELGAAFALVSTGGALRDAPTVADVFA
jgi:hypothetical protein